MADVLSCRVLNRTLLARQGLLERERVPALEMAERLVGLQAQVPENPYVALWARIADFDPLELSNALEARQAARAQLMRSTIHLVSARDLARLQPLTAEVLRGTFRSNHLKRIPGIDLDAVLDAGRELLRERPRSRSELARELGPHWPDEDAGELAHAVTFHLALVQVPPRGLWRGKGQPTWALTETWLSDRRDAAPSLEDMVLRYLRAFGPATVADARVWSRLTGLRAVFEELRPQLRTYADEQGRELFDVEDGVITDPDTPAPVRFLPEYDNLFLSYEDRSRVAHGPAPFGSLPSGKWVGTLVVDGFYRGAWKIDGDRLAISGFTARPDDPPGTAEAIEEEGARLVAFVAS